MWTDMPAPAGQENNLTETLVINLAGQTWFLESPADLETLWENITREEFIEDERLPYWANIWPASLALSTWLTDRAGRIAGHTGLELGCGLGLVSMLLARAGATIIGLDYEWPAVSLARANARRNLGETCQAPLFAQSDWRQPAIIAGSLDFIVAADILYEKRFLEPVVRFVDHGLKDHGLFWLAGPDRNTQEDFNALMARVGWAGRLAWAGEQKPMARQQTSSTILIWEFSRS